MTLRPHLTPLDALPPLTPDQARATLQARLDADWKTWIDTETIDTSPISLRTWIKTFDQAEATDALKREEIRRLITLPDNDLAWLLSMGWRPETHTPDTR